MNDQQREALPYGIAERLERSIAWLERGELLPGHSACIGLSDIKALHAALTQPQAQQAKTCHDSDCSVHNEPAYPAGPCDCGFEAQQAAAVPAGLLEPHVVEAAALAYEMSPCHDLIGPMEDALRAAIAAAPPAPVLPLSAWQPIETAPKDGSHILLFCQDSAVKIGGGYWFAKKNCWVHGGYMRRLSDPTHWQPLPATPITEPGAGGEG